MSTRTLLFWALLPLAACADGRGADELPPADGAARSAIVAGPAADRPAFEALLPWGEGALEVGRRAPREEFRGEGPSGIALTPDARVLLVDRLNHRLLEIDANGMRALAEVPEDVEHLAIAADGAAAAFSSLRSRAFLLAADGTPAGEVAVPRLGATIVGLRLDASHRIEVETALQERLVAGSVAAPQDEAGFLRSKREGAAELADGRGVVALAKEGRAELRLLTPREKGRVAVLAQIPVGDDLASLRILGVEGQTCVALAERVAQPEEALVVSRELLVVDLGREAVVGRLALPPPGSWVPTEDIAVGGTPLSVAWMTPENDGLRVHRVPVQSFVVRGGAK